MNEDSPSPAPANASESSPPPPVARPRAARAGLRARLKSAWAGVRRFTMALFGYPSGRWPAPTVTSLVVAAVVVVGAVELVPKAVSDVTLSVRARSEVLEIELDPYRTYVWWLPAGRYSLLTAKSGSGCEQRSRFDVACTYGDPTAITIKNGATVRFEVIAGGADGDLRFSAALTPREPHANDAAGLPASDFAMHDAADELLVETGDLVTFESGPVDVWRIPLIGTRMQIGELLSESISTADSLGAVRQPIMTEGDVRMFARSLGRRPLPGQGGTLRPGRRRADPRRSDQRGRPVARALVARSGRPTRVRCHDAYCARGGVRAPPRRRASDRRVDVVDRVGAADLARALGGLGVLDRRCELSRRSPSAAAR